MTNAVDQLAIQFADAEVQLGTSFFKDGRIELDEDGPTFFEARVEHFKRHVFVWVDLESSADGPAHGCDCPHFEENQTGCEHLWALKMLLDHDAEDEEVEDEDEDDDANSFRPVYLLQVSESLRKNCVVLSLHDESGGRIQVDHLTWANIHDDRDIAAIRKLAQLSGGWKDVLHGGGMYNPAGPWLLQTMEAKQLLKILVETDRLTWGDFVKPKTDSYLSMGGTGVELALRINQEEPIAIEGVLLRNRSVRRLSEADLLLPGKEPWIAIDGELYAIRAYGGGAWAKTLRTQTTLPIPNGKPWRFLEEVASTHPLPRLVAGSKAILPIEEQDPRARSEYTEKGGVGLINLIILYGETRIGPAAPGELALSKNRECQILRKREREADFIRQLLALGFEPTSNDANVFHSPKKSGRKAIRTLLHRGWDVVHRGLPVAHASAGRFAIRQGEDWFSLTGQVEVDGENVSIGALLQNYSPDSPWVQLDEDRAILLDEESTKKLDRFAGLSSFGSDVDGELRFATEQSLLARLVLGDQVIPGAPALSDVQSTLEKKLSASEEEPTEAFSGTLRPYQKAGLAWMSFLRGSGLGGCLADEMGLGKTVQVLAFMQKLASSSSRPFLVVAPLSLLGNWEREANQFCANLVVRQYHGASRSLDDLKGGEVVLTSYGVLRRDAEKLRAQPFELCVLDEAQAIKNQRSKTRLAAMGLQATMRLALSGTPLENRIDDLWSLLQFLNPALFRAGASLQSLTRVAESADPESWRQALRPLLLRRRKEEVATDLPELTEQTLVVAMSDDQRRAYQGIEIALRKSLLNKDSKSSPAMMLEGLLRLRQAACHPMLLPGVEEGRSGKIDLLVDHLEDAFASNRKCLVFSQFVGLLDLVDQALVEREITSLRLDGRTKNRQDVIDEFEDSVEPSVLLISLKVGGTGLNLTSAEVVFLLDPWWNPAVEAQAIARAHRIGQKRKVHAIRLVSDGTIEERILRLQDKKRDLADSILEAAPQALDGLTGADIQALLGA